MKVYIDGKFYRRQDAKISVFDHGLLYGDGVFEGIRTYRRLIFKLSEHLDRLAESAKTLMLTLPMTKPQFTDAIIRTLRANRLSDAYIRLVVTRGEGDLGLDPRKCYGRPTVIIITDKIVLYPARLYRQGLKIITVPTSRNWPEAINPQIKSLNYLNNILAKLEAGHAGYEEAIMLNPQGFVAECTGDNIFIVKRGALLTPPPFVGILKGITRQCVMDLARQRGVEAREEVLTRHDLFNADECFLTGTAAELIPVVEIDGRRVGPGRPGPVTLELLKEFRALTQADGVRYAMGSDLDYVK